MEADQLVRVILTGPRLTRTHVHRGRFLREVRQVRGDDDVGHTGVRRSNCLLLEMLVTSTRSGDDHLASVSPQTNAGAIAFQTNMSCACTAYDEGTCTG